MDLLCLRPAVQVLRRVYSAIVRPLFRVFYMRRTRRTHIGDIRLSVPPGVFHPGVFVSSRMLARHVGSLQLRGTRVLDMGTGSGVVGIFAEKAGALVLATDINPVAVMTATKNAALNHCSNFSARVSDLFEAIDTHEGFDLIAWNPPFYASVPTDIPSHAWYAGSRYAVIRRFAAVASDHLRPGGAALLVLSSDLDLPQLFLIFAENLWRANVLELRKGIFEDHLLVSLTRCGPVGGLSGG